MPGIPSPSLPVTEKKLQAAWMKNRSARLKDLLDRLRALDERRATVVASIEEQGKMTPELLNKLEAAGTLTALEDIYAPYKPKRRTRASIAREKGLQGLADLILAQKPGRESAEKRLRPLSMRGDRCGRSPGRSARHRRGGDQRPQRRCVRRCARKRCSGATLSCEKIDKAEDPNRCYETVLRLRGPHRPAAPAPGAGDQPRRNREGAAGCRWWSPNATGWA